jgi:pimeloyl-ACP methyl ester carboxylesterase
VNRINYRASLIACFAIVLFPVLASGKNNDVPQPPGKLVDLGGHRLHVHCSGAGRPTVVVETGLGDFSFDWALVQSEVAHYTRICTYDRAGYAWSDPGPKPRTFAQINLELHDALQKLGEKGPYVLVGHSYGGPVMINFATIYRQDVGGLVLVDSASEGMRVGVGDKQTIRLGEGAQIRDIPAPREEITAADKFTPPANDPPASTSLNPVYKSLPSEDQRLHIWAEGLPALEDAESNQREWSEVYFAQWLSKARDGSLGDLPLLVLTRADGGYSQDLDVPATQMEQERKDAQARLAKLSKNSTQVTLRTGHNMDLEAPAAVSYAIHRVVNVVRVPKPL